MIPTYQERLAEWQAKGYKRGDREQEGQVEAEELFLKSTPPSAARSTSTPWLRPNAEGVFRLNSFGWWRWRLPGQWVRWKVTVPEDGLYKISIDIWQGWAGRAPHPHPAHRRRGPFREARASSSAATACGAWRRCARSS